MDDLKLSLTITGSPAVLAAVLAGLPSDAVVTGAAPFAMPAVTATAPVGSTAIQTLAPAGVPPMPQGDDSDDENGPVDASAPDVDANGLPWDERIHSSNHARNVDGTWRKKRNVNAETVAAVEAQLRGPSAPVPAPMTLPTAMPMQPTTPMPVAAPQPMAAPVVQPQPMPMPVAAPQPMPMPAVAPVPVQQPVAAAAEQAAAGPLDFAGFMAHISGQMVKPDANGAPLVHADYLAAVAAEIAGAFGVELKTITDIAPNPQMITYAVQLMQRDGRW